MVDYVELIMQIIVPLAGIVLALLAGKYGAQFTAAKKFGEALINETQKLTDFMNAVNTALYDNTVTEEEFDDMYQHAMELKAATEALIKAGKDIFGIISPQ